MRSHRAAAGAFRAVTFNVLIGSPFPPPFVGRWVANLGSAQGALRLQQQLQHVREAEAIARLAAPPLAGRDHLAYRSAYYPVRHVVDGDLCEAYGALPAEARARIAGELERAPGEVVRKLEDVRARVL